MSWTRQTVTGAAIGAGLGAIAGAIGVGGLALVLLAGGVLGGVLASLIGVLGRLSIMDLHENDGYQVGAGYVALWLALLIASAGLVGGWERGADATAVGAGGPMVRLMEGAMVVAGALSGFIGGLLIGALARLGALAFLDPGGPRSQVIAKTGRTGGEFILGALLASIVGGPLLVNAQVTQLANAVLVGIGGGIGLGMGTLGGAIARLVGGSEQSSRRVESANKPLGGAIAGAMLGAIVGTLGGAVAGGIVGALVWRPAIFRISEPIVGAMHLAASASGAILGAGAGALLGTSIGAIAGAVLGALSTPGSAGTVNTSLLSGATDVTAAAPANIDRKRRYGAYIVLGAPLTAAIAGAALLAALGASSGIAIAAMGACMVGAAAGVWAWAVARFETGPLADRTGIAPLALTTATGALLGFLTGAALGALATLPVATFGRSGAFMILVFIGSVQDTGSILGEVMRWTTFGALLAGTAAGVCFPAIGREVGGTNSSPIGPILGVGAGALGVLLAVLGLIIGVVGSGIAWGGVAWGAVTGAIALAILAGVAAARPRVV